METYSDAQLENLTQQLAERLLNKHHQLATAESCTGGWLAKCCTDLAGSSAWFERGFIPYSNQAKQDLLSVSAITLEHYGAVSVETATEMAEGALKHSQASISVAITGIAGPTGGTIDKPIGTVCFAFASQNNPTISAQHVFNGDREMIRRQAVATALQGIIKNARDATDSMG
jgi:nicotinamide-nucleotide amidase